MPVRALSVHAHFYQPPREDPLTGIIPAESGAAPYQNWNEKIHAECYKPNAELRNFEQISFNIGPTLFNWMHAYDLQTSQQIIAQDRVNVHRHGVGNAIAQAYNHTILPLSSRNDKITQIYWGIADFQHHFGRHPQGLWLPETAVDLDTLDVLAQEGIDFTILAPWQAEDIAVDSSNPYLVNLPNKKQISVFFYNSELSSQVSFQPETTINADIFAQNNLSTKFRNQKSSNDDPQLILVASDGELYGHHQYNRHFFLARLVDGASNSLGIRPTYPALWLKMYPASRTIRIKENTSWSCHHGVTRWTGQCSCTPPDGEWKAYLRLALERLSAEMDRLYLDLTSRLFTNPWELRNRYIHVLLGEMSMETLANQMSLVSLTSEQLFRVHLMLEAQRERQRMFTSCGWFFEDFNRIEPKNNVAYAAQAVWLTNLATGVDLEQDTCQYLNRVISSNSGIRADQIFKNHLRRAEELHKTIKHNKIGFGI